MIVQTLLDRLKCFDIEFWLFLCMISTKQTVLLPIRPRGDSMELVVMLTKSIIGTVWRACGCMNSKAWSWIRPWEELVIRPIKASSLLRAKWQYNHCWYNLQTKHNNRRVGEFGGLYVRANYFGNLGYDFGRAVEFDDLGVLPSRRFEENLDRIYLSYLRFFWKAAALLNIARIANAVQVTIWL